MIPVTDGRANIRQSGRMRGSAGILLVAGSAFACARTQQVPITVASQPSGAQVHVDGESRGETPAEITLACRETWVGILSSPNGWQGDGTRHDLSVTLEPHTRRIALDACAWQGQHNTLTVDFSSSQPHASPDLLRVQAPAVAQRGPNKVLTVLGAGALALGLTGLALSGVPVCGGEGKCGTLFPRGPAVVLTAVGATGLLIALTGD